MICSGFQKDQEGLVLTWEQLASVVCNLSGLAQLHHLEMHGDLQLQ